MRNYIRRNVIRTMLLLMFSCRRVNSIEKPDRLILHQSPDTYDSRGKWPKKCTRKSVTFYSTMPVSKKLNTFAVLAVRIRFYDTPAFYA